MSAIFKGRPVVAGSVAAECVVSRQGVNTLATFQKSALKKAKCVISSDQNNPDLFGKNLTGKILCLPRTIGSTTGGLVLQTVCDMGIAPAALLFSESIDSLAAAGVILAKVWDSSPIIAVDRLGPEFLAAVKSGMKVQVDADGTVTLL